MNPLVVLLLLFLLGLSFPGNGEALEVRRQVTVATDTIYLSDLLALPTNDMVDFIVARAPRINQRKVINSSDLATLVQRRYPDTQITPDVEIHIERASQAVSYHQISQAVTEFVTQQWGIPLNHGAELTGRNMPQEVMVPRGALEVKVKSIRPHSAAADFKAWVDIHVANQWYQTLVLDYHIEKTVLALTAAEDIQAGTGLTEGLLRTLPVNRLEIECEPLTSLPNAAQTNVDISVGRPLCREYLSSFFSVKKGQAFPVSIQVGSVGLEVQLIAEENAVEGKVIEATRSGHPEQHFQVVFVDGSPRLVN